MSDLLRPLILAGVPLGATQLLNVTTPAPGVDEGFQFDRLRRFLKKEWVAWASVRVFALQLAFGIVIGVGTILALFAWSGAGL